MPKKWTKKKQKKVSFKMSIFAFPSVFFNPSQIDKTFGSILYSRLLVSNEASLIRYFIDFAWYVRRWMLNFYGQFFDVRQKTTERSKNSSSPQMSRTSPVDRTKNTAWILSEWWALLTKVPKMRGENVHSSARILRICSL